MGATKQATLRRKEHVPEEHRTDDRDKAADEIEAWIDEYGWPINKTRMAEMGEYSRQHYSNTAEYYFKEVPVTQARTDGGLESVPIPDDVDRKDYLRGVMVGMDL